MIDIVLSRAIEEYKENFKIAVSFAVLLIFVALFIFFDQFFFSSGTVFLSIDTNLIALVGIAIGLVFLYAFSFFVSLTVYSIQRDIHHLNLDAYWNVLLKSAALKIFFFYLLILILFYLISWVALFNGAVAFGVLLVLILSSLTMFVPQSIVLDEKSISDAIGESVSFWAKNPLLSFFILLFSAVLVFAVTLIEFVFDLLGLPGFFISLALGLIFLVPFTEQMKSYAFILKYELIRAPEVHHARHHKSKPTKVDATRLREKHPGGKI